MKRKVLLIAVLIMAVGVLALTACGGGSDTPGADHVPDLTAPFTPEMGGELTLPLTDELVTFRVWLAAYGGIVDSGLDHPGMSEWFQELERRTNVRMEFIMPPAGAAQENLNLLIAGGDLPDAIIIMGTGGGVGHLPGGMSAAIQDGFIIEASAFAERYAPYYWEVLQADPERRRRAFTDEGYLPGFWQVNVVQPPWYGMVTRQDWLDQLGLPMPVTFDDWHYTLTRFNQEFGAVMSLQPTGFHHFDSWSSAFAPMGWFNDNGRVNFGPLTPEFRDYVEMMHQWYTEGLINPDFAAAPFWTGPDDMSTTGQLGLWPDMFVTLPVRNTIGQEAGGQANMRSVGVPHPLRYEGQVARFGQAGLYVEWITLMTNANHNPQLFTRWVNYLFSPEGQLFANFGIEGDTFNFDATGTPRLTARMYDNPDWSLHETQRRYVMPPGFPFFYDWRRELTPGIEQDVYDAPFAWSQNTDFRGNLPPITLTAAEGTENARIMADVNTTRDEMVARFITGAEPMSNWDNFVQSLRNMGIERAMEIQQAAMDRFMAR